MKRSPLPDDSPTSENARALSFAEPFARVSQSPRRSFWPAGLQSLLASFLSVIKGQVRVTGWVNIYRAGYYHRAGKPNSYDRHPGDLYPTRRAALDDIEPAHLYVATVPVSWFENFQPHTNAADSKPVPVASSRRILARERGEFIDGAWIPQSQLDEQRTASLRNDFLQAAYSNPLL